MSKRSENLTLQGELLPTAKTVTNRREFLLRASSARRPANGLFPAECEIARRLSQDPVRWRALAIVLEREGLPRVCPIMGGRYWPAVLAYFNRRYGIVNSGPSAMDGMENLNALG
jgi:hypothetical protein